MGKYEYKRTGRPNGRLPQMNKSNNPCIHCGNRQVSRPRGLCGPCYFNRGIRCRYEPRRKSNQGGVGFNFCGEGVLPDAATQALPGSEEKLLVLEERAKAHVQLHHPQDGGAVDEELVGLGCGRTFTVSTDGEERHEVRGKYLNVTLKKMG